MKVLMINSVSGIGSTGRICADLAEEFLENGHDVKIAYGRESSPEKYKNLSIRIGNDIEVYIGALKTRLLDNEGFNNVRATQKFLKWADEYNPDLLWLHNLHGYYINVDLLFKWIKKRPKMQVKWTLHDCWAFTGHCSYFSMVKCDKWMVKCEKCIQKRKYPTSLYVDNSKKNYDKKKSLFTKIENMTIITPSIWLRNLVKSSFLSEYNVEVQYNKINRNIFQPTESDFRKRYSLEEKKIVLGVATTWDERKGLDDFKILNKMLNDKYQIILVGLSRKQILELPRGVMGIERTNNVTELAAIYTAADVFVNPSKEETFGMTTIEAMACGTPAIVYKDTACEEIVNAYGGLAVSCKIEALCEAIEKVCSKEN